MRDGTSPIVLLPTKTWLPLGARLMRVPDIVTAGPPGMSVCPSITYCDALFAVIVSDPTVKAGALVECRAMVLPAITIALAEGASDTLVPSMLITGAPGVSVWPATTYWELAFWVIFCEPTAIGTGPAGASRLAFAATGTDLTPLIITAEADGAIEIL